MNKEYRNTAMESTIDLSYGALQNLVRLRSLEKLGEYTHLQQDLHVLVSPLSATTGRIEDTATTTILFVKECRLGQAIFAA